MAKKKTATEKSAKLDALQSILKATGAVTLDTAGTVPYFIDTGNLAMNFMCSGKFIGGGVPGGRITEVYGPSATAKSLLGYCCLAACQRMGGIAVLLDCERSGNAEFAEQAAHVDASSLVTLEPISIEQVEKKIIAVTKAIREHYGVEVPILFMWDSIGVTPTEREWKETELPENPTQAEIKAVGLERPGERARASGDLLRKLNPFLNEQNATLFIINQVRKAIGVMYGNPNVTAGGGEALKFYCSCRLETYVGKLIHNDKGYPLGVNLRFANRKSRSCPPGMQTEGIQLFFTQGINPLGGMLTLLLQTGRIVEGTKKGSYKVAPEYLDSDEEVVFSAPKAENQIPMEVLLKAPRMVDAADTKEVEEYLSRYAGAIDLATGGKYVEKNAGQDGEETSDFVENLKKTVASE